MGLSRGDLWVQADECSCRHFEEILHGLPLLILATDAAAGDQALHELQDASGGRLQQLRCLLLASDQARSFQEAHHGETDLDGTTLSHELARLDTRLQAGALVPVRRGRHDGTSSASAASLQPYNPAVLVSGLRWLAEHRPEPPDLQV